MPSLLDLPVEVRHQIYRYLFCIKWEPVLLGRQDPEKKLWLTEADELLELEPTFHAALFRVNETISYDALRFAYSSNAFRIGKDVKTFSKLGPIALGSIKSIRLYRNCWAIGSEVQDLWVNINQRCPNLEMVILEASPYVLLGAVPYVRHFIAATARSSSTPKMVLDMNILARHFSFDDPESEYHLLLNQLRWNGDGHVSRWDQSLTYVMRLPRHVQEIRFVMDVGAGAFRAFQQILQEYPDIKFRQASDIPRLQGNDNKSGGRRSCFVWETTG
jgi:hypothetical protein